MSMRAPVPADVEAEKVAELIADAARVSLHRRPAIDRPAIDPGAVPRQHRLPIDITDQTIGLTEGYADYGV